MYFVYKNMNFISKSKYSIGIIDFGISFSIHRYYCEEKLRKTVFRAHIN